MATAPTTTNTNIRENVEIVMRQTSCYDVKLIKEKLAANRDDVVATICDLLDIRAPDPPKDPMSDVRTVLEEKDAMFHAKIADPNARKR